MNLTDLRLASNRKKKNKSVKRSSLENINGLGPKKRKNLMKHFKSVQLIKTASVDDLCKVSGISTKLAENINIYFKS
jgi:excinuclease ABC subunit C